MLTVEKANKILSIVIQDQKDLILDIVKVKEGSSFCCYYNIFDENIIEIEKQVKEEYYKDNILNYLYKKGLKNLNTMFTGSIEVFSLLHEIGHILNGDTLKTNNAKNFMQGIEGTTTQFKAYREIKEEAAADQFAINILNNEELNIKIWSIMEEMTEEVVKENKEFWSMMI
ncbi:MAG: ImmA/IrrE family metallo-endopeptidase [Sarcina sp.]